MLFSKSASIVIAFGLTITRNVTIYKSSMPCYDRKSFNYLVKEVFNSAAFSLLFTWSFMSSCIGMAPIVMLFSRIVSFLWGCVVSSRKQVL